MVHEPTVQWFSSCSVILIVPLGETLSEITGYWKGRLAVWLGQWVNITPCHIKMSDWFVTNCCTTCFSVRGLRGRWQTWGWGQRRTRWGVSKLIKTTQSSRFWALTSGQCWRRVCVNSWVVVPHFIYNRSSEKQGKIICYLSFTSCWYVTICSFSSLYLALSHSRHRLLVRESMCPNPSQPQGSCSLVRIAYCC